MRVVFIVSAITLAAVSVLLYTTQRAAPDKSASTLVPRVPLDLGSQQVPADRGAAHQPSAESSQEHARTDIPRSLSAEVTRGLKSGSPIETYRAYSVVAECALARDVARAEQLVRHAERQAGALEAAQTRALSSCGDLSEADTSPQRQIALLEPAAAAGVPGAAVRLANLGPFGDFNNLYTRPNDPLVLEWRSRMTELLVLAATKRDSEAMLSLSKQFAEGDGVAGEIDHAAAIKYAVAYKTLREVEGVPDKYIDRTIRKLTSLVSPATAKEAASSGREMVQTSRAGG
jgi:hypothetical protein